MTIDQAEATAAFTRWLLEHFWDGCPDECDIQDRLVELGILVEVPGGFDPETHYDPSGCAEPGDTFYMPADWLVPVAEPVPGVEGSRA